MNIEEMVEWWNDATKEEREEFLDKIGAYAVGDYTWYVHPNRTWKEEIK